MALEVERERICRSEEDRAAHRRTNEYTETHVVGIRPVRSGQGTRRPVVVVLAQNVQSRRIFLPIPRSCARRNAQNRKMARAVWAQRSRGNVTRSHKRTADRQPEPPCGRIRRPYSAAEAMDPRGRFSVLSPVSTQHSQQHVSAQDPGVSGAGIWIDGTAHPGVGTWTERTTGEPGTLYGGGRGRWDACMVQPSTGHMAWPWVLGGAGSVGAGRGDVRPRVLRERGDEPLRVCGARACCCCCVRGAVHQRRRVDRGVLWRIATRHLPRAAAPGTTARSNLYIYFSARADLDSTHHAHASRTASHSLSLPRPAFLPTTTSSSPLLDFDLARLRTMADLGLLTYALLAVSGLYLLADWLKPAKYKVRHTPQACMRSHERG